MKKKKLLSKVSGLVFAAAAMFMVTAVASPKDVSAADYEMGGAGTVSVAIPDESCYEFTGQDAYIKFTPKATGYVTITASNISAIYNDTYGGITLCDGSRRALSELNEIYNTKVSDSRHWTMTYGVKQKTTYYLMVRGMGGTQITASFKKVKKVPAITKRAKAKTLGRGKTASGVIIAGDKKADWYKISLPKSQKVNLSYSAKTNGSQAASGLKVTFCKSNGKNFVANSYDNISRTSPSNKMSFFRRYVGSNKTTGLLPGTYYVKVEPYTVTSSGYYTLKWK